MVTAEACFTSFARESLILDVPAVHALRSEEFSLPRAVTKLYIRNLASLECRRFVLEIKIRPMKISDTSLSLER